MTAKSDRYCFVGVPEIFSLAHCCQFVCRAFGEHTCYLVGSATQRMDFRDVDVVLIIPDEKWKHLFGGVANGEVMSFWSLLMVSIGEYMAKRTGLKIDFKIQSMTDAARHTGIRTPIGLFLNHDEPGWSLA